MSQLANSIEKHLERIEGLLNDTQVFASNPKDDRESALAAARDRLRAVMIEQQRALNIIEQTVESNEATDLASKCNPVDCPHGGPAPERLSFPAALARQFRTEQETERFVTPAIVGVVNLCKR